MFYCLCILVADYVYFRIYDADSAGNKVGLNKDIDTPLYGPGDKVSVEISSAEDSQLVFDSDGFLVSYQTVQVLFYKNDQLVSSVDTASLDWGIPKIIFMGTTFHDLF